MPKKSKEFSELLGQQKNINVRQTGLEQLKQKLEQSPLGELVPDIVVEPISGKKMSEVLNEFIKPYLATIKNTQQHRKLLDIAVIAWNTSFSSGEEQQLLIDTAIANGMGNANAEMKQEVRKIIEELIARKNRYFADERRLIVEYNLEDTGDDYHLSVASTLIEDSE